MVMLICFRTATTMTFMVIVVMMSMATKRKS